MKEKITLILVLAVLFAGCGIYSPTPPPKENQEYDYSFLENQNGITEELKLNFSEGKTEFSTKVSLPHWKITEIKFNAESNKEKTFETIIEIYDEKNIPASVPTTRFVNLIKGKQKIDLTELNFSIQKRGEYKIKLNFFEDGKKTNEYSRRSYFKWIRGKSGGGFWKS